MFKAMLAVVGSAFVLTAALAAPASAATSGSNTSADRVATNGYTVPEKAAVAAVETYQNLATGYCLDSNASRNVYTNPCGSGNSYQHWTVINNGSTRLFKNLATGYCLDSNASRNVYTNPCGTGNSYQNWTIIRNGGNILFKDLATGFCLDSNASRNVYTNPCGTGNSYQNWH